MIQRLSDFLPHSFVLSSVLERRSGSSDTRAARVVPWTQTARHRVTPRLFLSGLSTSRTKTTRNPNTNHENETHTEGIRALTLWRQIEGQIDEETLDGDSHNESCVQV